VRGGATDELDEGEGIEVIVAVVDNDADDPSVWLVVKLRCE
jgi:hypothetical protein